MNKQTVDFYNQNAEQYASSTINLDVNKEMVGFLQGIPFAGKILDAGCGSGRDLKNFTSLGYNAVGIDASEELVKIAAKNSGAPVECKGFLDIDWKNEFDGIWCMASLLHLNKVELKEALEKLGESMKPNAKFYASFKVGEGEKYDEKGRFFSYVSKEELEKVFQSVDKFKNIRVEFGNDDKLGRVDTQWVNVYAISNKPAPEPKARTRMKP